METRGKVEIKESEGKGQKASRTKSDVHPQERRN